MSDAPLHTYNVTGTLPGGVYYSVTVQAANATEAMAKATADEPTLKVTNVNQVN